MEQSQKIPDDGVNKHVELIKEVCPLSRRAFLRNSTAGLVLLGGAVVVGNILDVLTVPEGGRIALAKGVVLWERQRCSGCRTCEAVCTNYNNQGQTSSALARIILEKDYLEGEYEGNTCFQCVKPLCLLACPVAALQVDTASGTNARIIDERVCIGCQQCVQACGSVFTPPRPRYDKERRVSMKCHLCLGEPQCVKFCPYGALRFERSEEGMETGFPVIVEA
jgi:carbon-monoxide dehydrogenase iron sulfur subunit